MEVHKKLHELSYQHMQELKKLPIKDLQPELGLIQAVLSDILHKEMDIEGEDLDAATEITGLEKDSDYMIMVQEYMQKVQALKLGVPDE